MSEMWRLHPSWGRKSYITYVCDVSYILMEHFALRVEIVDFLLVYLESIFKANNTDL